VKTRGYAGIAEKGLKHLQEESSGYWTTETLGAAGLISGVRFAAKIWAPI